MTKDIIAFSDFQKLDLRVGKILKVEKLVHSERLVKMQVDMGQEIGIRQILAGIAQWYSTKQLIGKKFIFVVNLEAKKMVGEQSCGMMLASEVNGKCLLLPVNKKIPEGSVVR